MTPSTRAVAAIAASLAALLLSPTSGATTSCADLGGVEHDGVCRIQEGRGTYRVDMAYPTGYPDQTALAAFVARQHDEFVNWVDELEGPAAKELDIVPHVYRSASTETVVLTIGTNTGVRPVTTFRSFTYNTARRAPVTLDTLFTADPLAVLNPIVQRELSTRDATPHELTLDDYRTFALTDDTVTFFFPQGLLLPHVDGPLRVDIPRTDLEGILR